MEIEISKEAATELEEAVAWYEQEEAGLGARLVDAFEQPFNCWESLTRR